MSAFENATAFFHACEGLKGWSGCQRFVAPDATFAAQAEPLAEMNSVQEYCEWLAGLGKTALAGCGYQLHASAYDESTRTALFFGTFTAIHSGEGGPVPPTNRQTQSHYVYALTLDDSDRVVKMVKIWNGSWAMGELGWAG